MTGEAPPHERLARQLVEGRVGHVRRDERGLARAVDFRGRAGDLLKLNQMRSVTSELPSASHAQIYPLSLLELSYVTHASVKAG